MKILKGHRLGSVALAAVLSAGPVLVETTMPAPAAAQYVDEGYFYTSLAPHGQWFFQAEFGWVWHPTHVSAGWRPYTEGQWVWSDEVGWTWASYEPFGWATYHYGRWYFDPIYGWSWVPGYTWAPAWVNWRIESGYIGWAPLWPVYFDIHPEYRWTHWGYDDHWHHRHRGRDWDRWVFCRDRDFTSDRISRVAIRDRAERDRLYRTSRDVTRWEGGRADRIGYSIDRELVERTARQPIKRVRLEDSDRPMRGENRIEGDRMRVFRPRVQEAADKTPDRLGIAKAPRDVEEAATLRREKARLERVQGNRGQSTVARERENERGGAPQNIEKEPGAGRQVRMPAGMSETDRGRGRDVDEASGRAERGPEADRGRATDLERDRGQGRNQNRPADRELDRPTRGGATETDERGRAARQEQERVDRERGPQGSGARGADRLEAQQKRDGAQQRGREQQDQRGGGSDRLWKPEREPAGRQAETRGDTRGGTMQRKQDERPSPRREELDASPRQPDVRGNRDARPAARGDAPSRSQEAQRPSPDKRRESPAQPTMRREPQPREQQRAPQPQPQRMQRESAPRQMPQQRRPEVREAPQRRTEPAERPQRAPEPRMQQQRQQPSPSSRGGDGRPTQQQRGGGPQRDGGGAAQRDGGGGQPQHGRGR